MAALIHNNENDGNIFRILVASDCHIGYAEKDPIRFNDSLNTFEEILKVSNSKKVDLLLLGGDLFHENKPSRHSMLKTMELLRHYCMGSAPIQFEFLSDPSINFGHSRFPNVNYEDPNLNVSLPVFTIHGNHDDVTGNPPLCALDVLQASGLINFFGKYSTNVEEITVSPILLRKGDAKLAIYGIGSIKDERLHRMFLQKNVKFLRPSDSADWFNLLVLHQNRAKHGQSNYIPEHFLPDFFDLVVWGHEHPCRIDPEKIYLNNTNIYISQPGSTIATSLAEGEAGPKFCGHLSIKSGRMFKMDSIRLETVRPFLWDECCLLDAGMDPTKVDAKKQVEQFCKEKILYMLNQAKKEHIGKQQPKEPLIRLRVDYSGGFEVLNTVRFGRLFSGHNVANPRDLLLWHHKRDQKVEQGPFDKEAMYKITKPNVLDTTRVEDLVKKYFFEVSDTRGKLKILTEVGLGEAVKHFVDKEEKDALTELIKRQLERTQTELKNRCEQLPNEDAIDEELEKFRMERERRRRDNFDDKNEQEEAENLLQSVARISHKDKNKDDDEVMPSDLENTVENRNAADESHSSSDESKRNNVGNKGKRLIKTNGNADIRRGNRIRGRGRAAKNKTPVVSQSRTSQMTVEQSFHNSAHAGKKRSYNELDSEDDNVLVSDKSPKSRLRADFNKINFNSTSRKINNSQKGVAFYDDDSG